jgi:hypothetical protein
MNRGRLRYTIDMASDLSRPSVPVQARGRGPVRGGAVRKHDQLLVAVRELEHILQEVERIKRLATTAEDWRVLMLYIATQKPRVSQLGSFAKRCYAEEFGDAYDAQFANVSEGDKPPTARAAEIRAKRDCGTAYAVSERFDRTWKDLEALTWACKDIASSLDNQEQDAGSFNAYPDHLFESVDDAEARARAGESNDDDLDPVGA